MFVEVPGNWMSDPVEEVEIAGLSLRVVRREVVLADRIIGFKHWRSTAYGAQALTLLAVFGSALNEEWLQQRLKAEGADDALHALRELGASGSTVGEAELEAVLARLRSSEVQ